jgi:fumarate reductase subunit D
MEPRTDWNTPEFWITAITNIVVAILGILAARGLLTAEEVELWLALVQAIIVAVVPLVMAIVTTAYVKSRAEVKTALINRGLH